MARNPYFSSSGPILRRSVVAFFDVLGFTEMAKLLPTTGESQKMLRRIHSSLKTAKSLLNSKPHELAHKMDMPDFGMTCTFTDNIVLGWPIKDDGETELSAIYSKLAAYQFSMAVDGFFLRGAIAIGDVYIDEITVYGEGLIEAYRGESTLARDPRIILMPCASELAKTHMQYYGDPAHAPHYYYLVQDSDGSWFLNYLSAAIDDTDFGMVLNYELIRKHKVAVENLLRTHASNPIIWSKYSWVARYHNFFCRLYEAEMSPELLVELELYDPGFSAIL